MLKKLISFSQGKSNLKIYFSRQFLKRNTYMDFPSQSCVDWALKQTYRTRASHTALEKALPSTSWLHIVSSVLTHSNHLGIQTLLLVGSSQTCQSVISNADEWQETSICVFLITLASHCSPLDLPCKLCIYIQVLKLSLQKTCVRPNIKHYME